MSLRFLFAAAITLALPITLSTTARAEDAAPAEGAPAATTRADHALLFTPRAAGSRITFGADVWPTSSAVLATMGVTAQIAVARTVMIDLDVPWAFGGARELDPFQGSVKRGRAALGNVTAGVHGVIPLAPAAVLTAGGTISIPTRYVFQGSREQLDFVTRAAISRGFYDAYRFGPQVVYLRLPVGVEARFAKVLRYRGELVPEVWIPAASELEGRGPQLLLEHADEIEARAPFGFGGGLRVQLAFAITRDIAFASGDRLQAAIEPFLGYEPEGRGFFARLGVLTGLDSPLGFGFRSGRLLSLRTQVGFKF